MNRIRKTIAMGYTVAYATPGMLLSVIESAAASPGVLVIPPVMVPSKSSILILNTKRPTKAASSIGTTVITAPRPKSRNPLS